MTIEARRRIAPFRWSEIRDVTPLQRSFYDAARAYGWREVFAVPIHGPGNLQGLVTMATRRELSLRVVDFAILETMSRAVWERCQTAEGFGIFDPQRSRLSPRELECLQWAAAGKSDAAIGQLIGISSATALFQWWLMTEERTLSARSPS